MLLVRPNIIYFSKLVHYSLPPTSNEEMLGSLFSTTFLHLFPPFVEADQWRQEK
jgi:hypothetical protein